MRPAFGDDTTGEGPGRAVGGRRLSPEHPCRRTPQAGGAEAPVDALRRRRAARGRPRRLGGQRRRPVARPGVQSRRRRGGCRLGRVGVRTGAAGRGAARRRGLARSLSGNPVAAGSALAAEAVPDEEVPERQRTLFSWAEFLADTQGSRRASDATRLRRCPSSSGRLSGICMRSARSRQGLQLF